MPALQVVSSRASLATVASGRGEAVVFLHANVCDSRMWDDQLRKVAETNLAIAYDRRGFGSTRTEPEDHSSVQDLMAVVGTVAGNDAVTLVGCSQGGKIAIDAALRHPSRISRLILIAPSVGGAPESTNPPEVAELLRTQRQVDACGDPEAIAALKARLWLDGPLASEGRVGGQARALFAEMSGIALRSPPVGVNLDTAAAYDRLAEITAPTLVIWGKLDFPHIQKRSRHITTVLPHAIPCELDGVAHLPSLERPAEVTRLVTDFLHHRRATS